MKAMPISALILLLQIAPCVASNREYPKQSHYVSSNGPWKAWLSFDAKDKAHILVKSSESFKTLELFMSASEGDLEVLEAPSGDVIPARQYLKVGSCWASLAVSTDGNFLRFQQSGCGIQEKEIIFVKSNNH